MTKKEQVELLTIIKIIESDINIHEDLLKDYEIKGKKELYYFGLAQEKKDRINYLNSYLKMIKKIYNGEKNNG